MAKATGRRWRLVPTLSLAVALSSNCSLSRGTTQLVAVRSTPPGAEVSLNGEPVGETPLFVEVRRRDAEPVLRFEEAGFESIERELERRRSGWFWGDVAVAAFFGGAAFFGASISSGVGAGTAGYGALWATAFLAPPLALGTAYGFPDRVRVVLPPLDETDEPAEASVGGTAGRTGRPRSPGRLPAFARAFPGPPRPRSARPLPSFRRCFSGSCSGIFNMDGVSFPGPFSRGVPMFQVRRIRHLLHTPDPQLSVIPLMRPQRDNGLEEDTE